MKLSIVVPWFNEERSLPELLERVLTASIGAFECEILLVDDGSTDRSVAVAREIASRHPQLLRILPQECNRGKGAAVRAGLAAAMGDIILIQDADLEYDPAEYPKLLAPFDDPAVQVVYGSRILGSANRSYNRYYWGGRLVTAFTNLIYGCRITDEPTGFKVFRRSVIQKFDLVCDGFEFCPEITAKLLRRGFFIHEVPITYRPRSFEEGKKINWRDGFVAIWTLLRFRFY